MHSLLPLLLAAVALPAHAAVYKCKDDKGGVTYQDIACAPGRELRNLDVDPAAVSVVPPTPPADKSAPASAKPSRVQSGIVTIPGGNAAERKFLRTGMSEAEVIQKVGRPDVETAARGNAGRRWTYLPTAGDPDVLTTLTWSGVTVAHVERKVMR